MTPRILVLAVAAALTATVLTGCMRVAGPTTSETREISDVTAVVLDTSGDVEITEGEPSLTIHAPANVLDRLTSEVRGGVLELGRRGGPMPFGGDIRYELTVPSLASIEINGSGDVTSTVVGEALAIAISGSGDVTVSGRADSLDVEIDGSGEVDADDLEVADATVEISGSGDAELHVTGTLRVDISGSGSVTHRGGAQVDADISGSGSVEVDD
jgi:hypothetical protein